MIYIVLRFISFCILKTFFGLEVYGRENLPKKGGFLVAANHVSYIDPVALGVACPRKLNYMGRSDLFKRRCFGWLLLHLHVFPVRRGALDLKAIKESLHRVGSGEGLLLFPEGRRTVSTEIARPQPGIGFLASKLNVPVIPAFIKGTDKAMPKGAKKMHPERISIHFGKQIHVERGMPYQDIAYMVMSCVRHLA